MEKTMSDAVADTLDEPEKSKRTPVLVGLILALAGAGGGFFFVTAGLLGQSADHAEKQVPAEHPDALADIAFVELDTIMISLTGGQNIKHLRFRAQLEVNSAYQGDVEHILPRVTDVLNGYLRALDVADLEDPLALIRLRSQMLRRVQLVAGKGRVRDLLIMEFVLN